MNIARYLLGLGLLGYGLLVMMRVMAHESVVAGAISFALGLALLVPGIPPLRIPRARLVAGLGTSCVAGVLLYNGLTSFQLGAPEIGLIAYGTALLVLSPHLERRLGRTDVATIVGWSFPLLLAPLTLFAANAVLSGPAGISAGSAAQPLIVHTLVLPMAAGLNLFGTPAEMVNDHIILTTTNGRLALSIGLVCAGLYPMLLFAGILGLHAWQSGLSKARFAAYLSVGLLGLYAMNLVRLILLAKVGEQWGGAALQSAHAHLGWLLFGVFMVGFWWLVLRHLEAPVRHNPAGVESAD